MLQFKLQFYKYPQNKPPKTNEWYNIMIDDIISFAWYDGLKWRDRFGRFIIVNLFGLVQ